MAEFLLMKLDLHESPKVAQVAARLGIAIPEVVGHLHRMWGWARRHANDDGYAGAPAAYLDTLCGAEGWSAAMIDVGWVVEDGDGVAFPEYSTWIGRDSVKRAKASQRQRDKRARDVTLLSRPERDETRTRREEKRKEEKREEGDAAHPVPPPQEIEFTAPAEPEDPDNPIVVAAQLLAEAKSMSRASVAGAGAAIARAARENPCGGHGQSEVIRAAFAAAAKFVAPSSGVGQYRSAVVDQIRKAAENGELPEVWAKSGGQSFAERAKSDRESKLSSIRRGGAA